MTTLSLYLAFGILNAVVAFDQGILMISMRQWRRSLEAWIEVVCYVLLWPLQAAYWVYAKTVNVMYWIEVRVLARWMS